MLYSRTLPIYHLSNGAPIEYTDIAIYYGKKFAISMLRIAPYLYTSGAILRSIYPLEICKLHPSLNISSKGQYLQYNGTFLLLILHRNVNDRTVRE